MNTQEIKTNLISIITKTGNTTLLMEMSKLIDIDLDDEVVVKLNRNQKKISGWPSAK